MTYCMQSKWKTVRLGKIVFFSQGIQVPFEKQYLIKFNDSVRFIRIVDITNPNEPLRYIENPGKRYLISKTDLAMVRYGTPGLPIMGKEGAIANNLFRIIPKDEISIINRYLYYYFLQPQIQNYLLTVQPSSTMPSITFSVMKDLKINLPPLEEQEKIAGMLGSLDDKIELLREENKTLEAMAQAIFKSWFVDFDIVKAKATGIPKEEILSTYKITEDIYNLFPDSFTDSSLAPIPTGWEVKQIKDIINIQSGYAFKTSDFSSNGIYKLVTIKNVQDGEFIKEVKDKIKAIPHKMPEYCYLTKGDILLSLTGNVGRVCLVNGINYVLNQRVAKLCAKNEHNHFFTYLLFRSKDMMTKMQSLAVGSAQQNLSPILTGKISIIVPLNNIFETFGSIYKPMLDKILENTEQIQTLTETRDTLLPQLISGKIRL